MQAALYRIEALQDAVKVKQTVGTKVHTWLTPQQVEALFQTCEDNIFGQRDRVVLGLLVAAGLRREEVVNLRFEDAKVQPVQGSNRRFRTVLGVKGKGAKNRIVPISDALATAIREWSQVVSGVGYIARS